ncbi:MAG TPA: HAMP domain-containing sensor histidine kinase [Herpetosiphonaceae bacterium]
MDQRSFDYLDDERLWLLSLLHDLKGPLKTLQGISAFVLSDACTPEQQRELLSQLGPTAKQIERRLAAVFDVIRSPLQRPTAFETLDLGTLVTQAVDRFREAIWLDKPQHPDRALTVTIGRTSLPMLIYADRFALERSLENVLLNSIEAGASHIKLRLQQQAARITLTIRDDGCGFPAYVLSAPLSPGRTTKQTGLGMGLISVAANVRACGGQIQLANWPGGAQVEMWFPRAGAV